MAFDSETNEIVYIEDKPSCTDFPLEFDPKTKTIVHKPGPNKCKKMVVTMEKETEGKIPRSESKKVTYKIGF